MNRLPRRRCWLHWRLLSGLVVGALVVALSAGARGADILNDDGLEPATFNQFADNPPGPLLGGGGGGSPNAQSAPGEKPPVELSQAELITRLERSMLVDEERLKQLRDEIAAPDSEYRRAEAAFKQVDERLAAKQAELDALRLARDTSGAFEAQHALEELKKQRALAQKRFDLAIETRRTQQEQIAALEGKQRKDRAALERLTGENSPSSPPVLAETPSAPNAPAEAALPPATPPAGASAPPAAAPDVENGPPAAPPPPVENGASGPPKPPSKELVQAQHEAHAKKELALAAEREAQTVSERVSAMQRDIELETRLLLAARRKSDIAYQTGMAAEAEWEKGVADQLPAADLKRLQQQWHDFEQLFHKARMEVRERTDRVLQLQTQLAELQREELAALTAAQQKQVEAEVAERKVVELQNPFSPQNLLQWGLNHGVQILVILITLLALRWLVSLTSQRLVSLIVNRGSRGTAEERADRAKTLVDVFQNAASVALIVSGVMMICEEVGIAVGPLMGGAAVLGLAVAFGAQNLLRDYFYGFVILLENQYKLNDVLRIGAIAGKVEQITLRMTVLRDIEGNVHFIPNGKIDSVTNMTHGWSRAVIDVGIAYKEDADRVMDLLMEIARELRRDEAFGILILDEPEMLGVDSLGDSAVTIRMLLKTRALSKWPVRRELLRRIKRRFDELGIEIPFPHRTVYHRHEYGAAPDLEPARVHPEAHESHESHEAHEEAWPRRKSA